MKFLYRLNIADFRTAFYFGSALRMQRTLKIAATVVICSIIYTMGGYIGLWPLTMFPAYICIGYGVWFIFCLARSEHVVLKYMKSAESVLGKEMALSITEEGMLRLETQGEKQPLTAPVKQMFMAFETSNHFSIYINTAQTVILPKRAMGEQEVEWVRELFGRKLKDRFETRYGVKPERKKRRWLRF